MEGVAARLARPLGFATCLFALLPARAAAHPFAASFTGHDLLLRVEAGRLDVLFRLDLPRTAALREIGALDRSRVERWLEDEADAIERDLRLEIDGRPVPWRRLRAGVPRDERRTGPGGGSLPIQLELEAPLPAPGGPLHVAIRDAIRPGVPTVLRARVIVDPAWEVTASSHFQVEGGRARGLLLDRWTMEEFGRELWLDLRPRTPAPLGFLRPSPRPRPAWEALPRPPWRAASVAPIPGLLGWLVGLALAGAAPGGRLRLAASAAAGVLLAGVVAGAPLPEPWGHPLATALAGGLALALAPWARRPVAQGSLLALALAGSGHPALAAGGGLAALLGGMAAPPRAAPWGGALGGALLLALGLWGLAT